mmetsp:Transcript_101152/g.179582  ORF Transcript_101152/g.179582 Transcript_101152/m.179582 type:complete len:551 (-) Transcript_101152:105-1757(-)|eukprot:CAMPEP_0197650906 /NCGR_PEP_ID=MMETSP1338-20131121/31231_1 /TAXON_ID=43686 ORGANISM="Pelagodinium beii, Strain RCC1491" /NCGR_SAMPLE_ID=MMETSP1338 /ASSEMBLY_ACC=CAM_ASM_000754 /LENGTH=550 /DNA_ID=CAMNT_0043225419 /DNA_START=56 /DNA_END=1708 /DNA_ORIENTATION=+
MAGGSKGTGAAEEPEAKKPTDAPAGGLDMPPPAPQMEAEAFPGESALSEDERNRWLVFHVALPRTIMTWDMALGRSTEAELNDALSNLAWGSVDTEAGEWTLESPDPSPNPPHTSLITYATYVARTYPSDHTMEDKAREENARLAAEKRAAFTHPGEPGAKFRPMFDQMVKNLQHSNKALAKAYDIKKVILNEDEAPEDPNKSEAQNIMRFGRHQILPSFWNMLIQLTKRGRRFSVVFRSFSEEQLSQVQSELQLFCQLQHPAYNGQNKTQKPPPMDGNKASRDMRLTNAAVGRCDRMSGRLLFKDRAYQDPSTQAISTSSKPEEAAPAAEVPAAEPDAAFRPTEYAFPPYHQVYAGLTHQILTGSNTAAIVDDLAYWEQKDRSASAGKLLLIDHGGSVAETKVQHIFFDGNIGKEESHVVDVRDATSGERIPFGEVKDVFMHRVDFFQAVTDVDYFLKATAACEINFSKKILEARRAAGISKSAAEQESKNASAAKAAMPPKEWLYRNVIPALLPALEACQRDRPEDPIEFIAFYMLRHSKQYSKTLKA